ncbi:MAG: hypothetical protein SPF74_01605 [Candidatus Limivicinus sp.]|nr:hypothetical protein [Candidatus Limivicinus sp.]
MKKLFSILLILTLCLTAFTACGGKAEPGPVPTAAPTAEPAAEPTAAPTAEPAAEPAAPSEADPIAAYADVFATYTTLLSEGWGGEELMAHDLPLLIMYCVGDAPFDNMGYLLLDVDGDGTQELLTGTLASDEFYAPIVFEMYTLNPEGSVVRVFSSQERARYYLCDDNTFLFEGANSAADSVRCFYSYAAGTLTEIPDAGAQPQTLGYIPFSQLNR